MALFGKRSNEKKTEKAAPAPASSVHAPARQGFSGDGDYSHLLKHARVTEKAGMSTGAGVYVFDVSARATKRDIAAAVRAIYKVTPRKVAVVTVPAKKVRHMKSGRIGVRAGGKKAYVFLKRGETITLS